MLETLVPEAMPDGAMPELGTVPPSPEVQAAMAASPDFRVHGVGATAVEEIMRTDSEAAFEWPSAAGRPSRGVSYTPPSGDA